MPACWTLLIVIGLGFGQPAAEPDGPASRELRRIRAEDQKDRQFKTPPTAADWKRISARDAKRLARVRELLVADRPRTATDFDICALIFQHGSTKTDYLVAKELALTSNLLGQLNNMPALAEDRFLGSVKRLQRFGSQYRTVDGKEVLTPVLEDSAYAVTDALRLDMFLPPLAIARVKTPSSAMQAGMNQILTRVETRLNPEWQQHMVGLETHAELNTLAATPTQAGHARALELYHGDLLFVPLDYANAAKLIAFEPTADRLALAADLAMVAAIRRHGPARLQYLSLWDAFLKSIGEAPRFEPRAKDFYPGVARVLTSAKS